jgi:hypothetical protein
MDAPVIYIPIISKERRSLMSIGKVLSVVKPPENQTQIPQNIKL